MGILGLSIQRANGIPIISKTWGKKLASFEKIDPMLTAGFMSAITSFADSFEQNIDFIQLSNKIAINRPESSGISAVLHYLADVMIICFAEPYLFLDKVKLKLQWIYENFIEKKLKSIGAGDIFTLTGIEEMFIEDILFDKIARLSIEEKKEDIINALLDIEKYYYQEEIKGFSINSFDNSILFNFGIEYEELQELLCNMGRGGRVRDWEVQYKPVWLGASPILVSYTNSAVKIPVAEIIGKKPDEMAETDDMNLAVPLYYYIITDISCSIGPIMEKLNTTLHPILMDY
ncbi:MAG: hypothetical protein ACTSQI_11770 [Candidatus Helarchaeota archaeon]